MKKALLLMFALWLLPGSANAAPAPEWLVQAIIKIESGGNPYAVHVDGAAHYPEAKDEALRLVANALRTGASFDLGIMQINRFWIDKFNIPPESLLDPAINMEWGRRILSGEIARHGLTWKAVGKYHSPDAERGRLYAWKIFAAARALKNVHLVSSGEINHAEQEQSHNNVPDAGGIQRRSGQRPAGRVVTFDVSSSNQPGPASQKP